MRGSAVSASAPCSSSTAAAKSGKRRVAHALQRPERLAPVEADGAEGIGTGERLQAALGEPRAAPERQRIGIAVAALGDQALGLREMRPFTWRRPRRRAKGSVGWARVR